MIKVLNIAQFIPIEALQLDNDISLKIYADLFSAYGIQSEFVKSVGSIPRLQAILRKSSKIRRDIYTKDEYYDKKYNIRIHFFKDSFPFVHLIPFNIDFLGPIQFNLYKKYLTDLIDNYHPDLIHAHSIYKDGYYALELYKIFNIPYIITLRGIWSKFYDSKTGKKILNNAKAITTPSYTLWSKLKDEINIELIPHGIDERWFFEGEKKFKSGLLRLVTVCRLIKLKNIQVVLKTVERLIASGYNVSYDIIGDGDYLENLKNQTRELNVEEYVRFHGLQNSEYVRNVYKYTDIFVMLSYPETFGLSFFEAAAQGLYIIGVKNTGAYGHLNEDEASFIDIDEFQLLETLKKINTDMFYSKTCASRDKVNAFRNYKIISRYYNIISGIV